jgi:hypothetical protein
VKVTFGPVWAGLGQDAGPGQDRVPHRSWANPEKVPDDMVRPGRMGSALMADEDLVASEDARVSQLMIEDPVAYEDMLMNADLERERNLAQSGLGPT